MDYPRFHLLFALQDLCRGWHMKYLTTVLLSKASFRCLVLQVLRNNGLNRYMASETVYMCMDYPLQLCGLIPGTFVFSEGNHFWKTLVLIRRDSHMTIFLFRHSSSLRKWRQGASPHLSRLWVRHRPIAGAGDRKLVPDSLYAQLPEVG